ncbi:c-type cytochrome [Nitrosovibrio sp. Nv17]|uniref:c-type cytochrome n=1 Tax=Nitrosovibrio sp. Nv17 TaxID=1855339 RepID=UPI0009086869|nr:Cytochrome c553 [Nitrosovibrio sp. Nv17]
MIVFTILLYKVRECLHRDAARCRLGAGLLSCLFCMPSGAAPAAPVADTMEERVKACTICHGPGSGSGTYYPRIAGKPQGYLFNQLRSFRDGGRYYRPMALLLANVSDDYLREMAAYFSALSQPYPPPERAAASPAEIRIALELVNRGDPARDLPACVACHGGALMGAQPHVPGLLGLPRAYLAAQLGAWQRGGLLRGQAGHCMSTIARGLTPQETNAVAAWLAAQPVPEGAVPDAALAPDMARRCGSVSPLGRERAAAPAKAAGPRQRRGSYLARIGNCMGCHTAQGGRPYAGGRQLSTPFGTFVSSNLTPDDATGIGRWSEEDFWQALHEGRSRDGRLLYPAFPYTEYTRITRADSDALFAHLRSLAPVPQRNPPNRVDFPYNLQPLLALWRLVYFTPGVFRPDPARSGEWNRGAYLVQGPGHCNACHAQRNPLGATAGEEALGGGQIMGSNWYAPSLTASGEAGSAGWPVEEIARLLTTGVSRDATTSGPMADVVRHGLQHLTDADARAMAVYLQSLPETAPQARPVAPGAGEQARPWLAQGARLYEKHCRECHGAQGEGAPGVYPPLAGSRGASMTPPVNAIRSILNGGYPPSTAGNPRPYGMPPFAQLLNDEEVAMVLSYVRNAWGNRAALVTRAQVDRSREGMH